MYTAVKVTWAITLQSYQGSQRWRRATRLQRLLEEVQHGLLHLLLQRTADPVRFLRVHQHLELLALPLQDIGHLHAVLEMHVVVLNVVQDQQPRLDLTRVGLRRARSEEHTSELQSLR